MYPSPQVKGVQWVIEPDEYDHAALLWPERCPLVLMGDHRSGARLLRDAAADSSDSIASLSARPSGRRKLRRLADMIEGLLANARAGRPVQLRPPPEHHQRGA